jgi:RHS repeat-associated protein
MHDTRHEPVTKPATQGRTLQARPIRAIMTTMPTTRRKLTTSLAAALLALLLAPLAGAEVWSSGTYVYDGAGNITRIGPDVFSYDRVSRLGAATIRTFDGTAHTQSYSYDVHGNIMSMTTNGQPASMPAVNAATNRFVGYDYDAAGNQRGVTGSPYYRGTFDAVNMMTARTLSVGTERYLYTADDERIAVVKPNGETLYTLRGLDGKVLREFKRSVTGTVSWEKDYIWRGGSLLATIDKAGLTTHYHLDHLGTPRLLTDATGEKLAFNTYYPFGREIDDADPALGDRMKFTGHERDAGDSAANALDYMHARYYGHAFGRFLSVDPIGGHIGRPQSFNAYAYVSNRPTVFIDPLGLEMRCVTTVDGEQCDVTQPPVWSAGDLLARANFADGVMRAEFDQWASSILANSRVFQELDLRARDIHNSTKGGGLAFTDGFIPFFDPFEELYQDLPVDGLEYSKASGMVVQVVATSAAGGQAIRATQAGKASTLFARKGLLNSNDYLRIGWNWKGTAKNGYDVFRISIFGKGSRIPAWMRHIDFF